MRVFFYSFFVVLFLKFGGRERDGGFKQWWSVINRGGGVGPTPYQFQVLGQVAGPTCSSLPKPNVHLSLTNRWIIPTFSLSFHYLFSWSISICPSTLPVISICSLKLSSISIPPTLAIARDSISRFSTYLKIIVVESTMGNQLYFLQSENGTISIVISKKRLEIRGRIYVGNIGSRRGDCPPWAPA